MDRLIEGVGSILLLLIADGAPRLSVLVVGHWVDGTHEGRAVGGEVRLSTVLPDEYRIFCSGKHGRA